MVVTELDSFVQKFHQLYVLSLDMLLAIFTTIFAHFLSLPISKKVLHVSVSEQGEKLLGKVRLKKLQLLKILLKKLLML